MNIRCTNILSYNKDILSQGKGSSRVLSSLRKTLISRQGSCAFLYHLSKNKTTTTVKLSRQGLGLPESRLRILQPGKNVKQREPKIIEHQRNTLDGDSSKHKVHLRHFNQKITIISSEDYQTFYCQPCATSYFTITFQEFQWVIVESFQSQAFSVLFFVVVVVLVVVIVEYLRLCITKKRGLYSFGSRKSKQHGACSGDDFLVMASRW